MENIDIHTVVQLVAAGWLLLLAQLIDTKGGGILPLFIWKIAPVTIALTTIYFAVN